MNKILQSIMCLLLLCACGGKDSEIVHPGGDKPGSNTPQATVSVSENTFVVPDEGCVVNTVVTSSDAWTLSDAGVTWCTPSATSGKSGDTISFQIGQNISADDRNATYTVNCGSASVRITITQKQHDALTVTTSKYELDAAGGEITVEIKSNIEFSFNISESCREWVSFVTTRAMQASRLVFEVAANESAAKREGEITISGGTLSETVHIYQSYESASIVLTQNSYDVPAAGAVIAVELSSNVDVTVGMPDADWITRSVTRAMSTHTFYFDVATNVAEVDRSATIVFENVENMIRESVTINQQAAAFEPWLIVSPQRFDIGIAAEDISFTVEGNVDAEITSSGNVEYRSDYYAGNGARTYTVHVNRSEDGKERRSEIYVRNSEYGIDRTIVIIQRPSDFDFGIDGWEDDGKDYGGMAE